MATAPGSNERLYCAGGGAASRISRAARVALKDQRKMALVNHVPRNSRLPLTLSLSDSETKLFVRSRASAARPIRISF